MLAIGQDARRLCVQLWVCQIGALYLNLAVLHRQLQPHLAFAGQQLVRFWLSDPQSQPCGIQADAPIFGRAGKLRSARQRPAIPPAQRSQIGEIQVCSNVAAGRCQTSSGISRQACGCDRGRPQNRASRIAHHRRLKLRFTFQQIVQRGNARPHVLTICANFQIKRPG